MDLKTFKERFPKNKRDNLFVLKNKIKDNNVKESDLKDLLKAGYSLPMIETFLNENGINNIKYSTLYKYSKQL